MKLIKENVLISEIDEVLENKFYEEVIDFKTTCGEDTIILCDPFFLRIKELDIDIYFGVFCNKGEDGEWEADFSLYVFCKMNTKVTVYDEGGSSLEACINNYCFSDHHYVSTELRCDIYEA